MFLSTTCLTDGSRTVTFVEVKIHLKKNKLQSNYQVLICQIIVFLSNIYVGVTVHGCSLHFHMRWKKCTSAGDKKCNNNNNKSTKATEAALHLIMIVLL